MRTKVINTQRNYIVNIFGLSKQQITKQHVVFWNSKGFSPVLYKYGKIDFFLFIFCCCISFLFTMADFIVPVCITLSVIRLRENQKECAAAAARYSRLYMKNY